MLLRIDNDDEESKELIFEEFVFAGMFKIKINKKSKF